jgi:hypothetical protein
LPLGRNLHYQAVGIIISDINRNSADDGKIKCHQVMSPSSDSQKQIIQGLFIDFQEEERQSYAPRKRFVG